MTFAIMTKPRMMTMSWKSQKQNSLQMKYFWALLISFYFYSSAILICGLYILTFIIPNWLICIISSLMVKSSGIKGGLIGGCEGRGDGFGRSSKHFGACIALSFLGAGRAAHYRCCPYNDGGFGFLSRISCFICNGRVSLLSVIFMRSRNGPV